MLDRRTRRLDGDRVLLGGEPVRLVRLSAAGAAGLTGLIGEVNGAASEAPRGLVELAERLARIGVIQPRPALAELTVGVTVVIPVRDDAGGLEGLLARLGAAGSPALPIVVVDDGSRHDEADRIERAAAVAGASHLRHDRPLGPAAARNRGLEQVATDLVAFLDADTSTEPGWLGYLIGHLDDPAIAVVAPRVAAGPARSPAGPGGPAPAWRPPARSAGALLAYERDRSPLDLGPWPGLVGPDRGLRYVPAAALVARVADLRAAGGFDRALHHGEDVDLVWRLVAGGRAVRYEPAAVVIHSVRPTLRAFVLQRYRYGRSAAALDRRHRGAVPAFEASPTGLLLASALAAAVLLPDQRARRAAAGIAASTVPLATWRLGRKLGGAGLRRPRALAFRLVAGSSRSTLQALRSSARRAWWPLAIAAMVTLRRRPAVAAAAGLWLAWPPPPTASQQRTAAVSPGQLLLGLLDDASYGTGVIAGCLRAGRIGPLLPARRPRRAR